jgi:ankyrin repeat protein
MRIIYRLIFSLFLIITYPLHLNSMQLASPDPIIFKDIDLPEIRDFILFGCLTQSFRATDPLKKTHYHLMSMSLVCRELYSYINSPGITRTIVNTISNFHNQNFFAKKLGTLGMTNYLKKNTILYKYIGSNFGIKKTRRLIKQGGDVHYQPTLTTNKSLQSPLLFRALPSHKKTKIVLNHGANVNIIFRQKTALQLSIEHNKLKTVKLLLTRNPQDLYLDLAIYYQNRKIINAILRQKNIPVEELNRALGVAILVSDKITIDKLIIAGAQFEMYVDAMKEKFTQLTNNNS